MEEKLRFVFEYQQHERTMTELCERYGIARETGYVWLRRYQALGWEGLREKSRARQGHKNQTAEEIEHRAAMVRVRRPVRSHRPWRHKNS